MNANMLPACGILSEYGNYLTCFDRRIQNNLQKFKT